MGNGATLFLLIGGAVTIFGSAMKVLAWLLASTRSASAMFDGVANLSDFAFFIAAIWGSVQVFGEWEHSPEMANP